MLFSLQQFLYCGKKAALAIGNVLPVGSMPEGTIVCNLESVSLSLYPSPYHIKI